MESNNKQDKINKQQELLRAKEDRFLHLCHSVFKNNAEGAELIAILKDSFIEKLPVSDPDKSSNHAYFREGQNSVIRALLNNIKVYEARARQ